MTEKSIFVYKLLLLLNISYFKNLDELEKQLFIKKTWSGPVKNIGILRFTKNFKKIKKIKKNAWRYYYLVPVYQQSSWYHLQFLRYRVWQVEIGNYGSFFAIYPSSKNLENQNFEEMEKKKKRKKYICWRYQVYQKWQSYETQFLKYGVRHRIFCHFGPFFAPLPHYWPQN